ncbi:MAG: hypothetical protein U0869_08985 [Chloroflexota bacterium]
MTDPAHEPRRPGVARGGHRVFVRPEALALERPGDRHGRVSAAAPDAGRAIETLEAFGYEVVLLPAGAAEIDLAPRDWLLTGDAGDCRWARRRGARTVLVGADATVQASQPERCDLTVNSLYSAAIEMVMEAPDGDPPAGDRSSEALLQPDLERDAAG